MNKGQSLFEIIVAVGFISVVMFALVSLGVQTQRNTSNAKNRSEAARFAQEAMEWLRAERDSDWDSFYGRSAGSGTYCLNNLNWNSAGECTSLAQGKAFSREAILTRTGGNPDIVGIEIRMEWTDSQGNHSITTTSHLTNWRIR